MDLSLFDYVHPKYFIYLSDSETFRLLQETEEEEGEEACPGDYGECTNELNSKESGVSDMVEALVFVE